MNADAFRNLYEYHFTLNRKIWDECVVLLTLDQFVQPVDYGIGSVRNQVVHMLNIDERWFSGLRGVDVPGFINPVHYGKQRDRIRAKWDAVEADMRAYLATLHDEMLFTAPFAADGDSTALWQVLIHVTHHGADHRAQLLRLLHDLGVETFPQDYISYWWQKQSG